MSLLCNPTKKAFEPAPSRALHLDATEPANVACDRKVINKKKSSTPDALMVSAMRNGTANCELGKALRVDR